MQANDVSSMVTAWATVVLAVIAAISIGVNTWIIFIYRKQVKIGQDQVRLSQDALYEQHRPLLIPDTILNPPHKITNEGTGIALNVRGYIFYPKSSHDGKKAARVTVLSSKTNNYVPQGKELAVEYFDRELEFNEDCRLAPGVALVPSQSYYRLVITYQDVFDQNLASVFDYMQMEWKLIKFPKNISKEALDIMEKISAGG